MATKGKINVEKWDLNTDGELTEANMRKKLKGKGYNCILYEFQPGQIFPDHTHGHAKRDAILSGQFEMFMYGQKVILQPGDMIDVPANTIHSAGVVGNKPAIFLEASVIY